MLYFQPKCSGYVKRSAFKALYRAKCGFTVQRLRWMSFQTGVEDSNPDWGATGYLPFCIQLGVHAMCIWLWDLLISTVNSDNMEAIAVKFSRAIAFIGACWTKGPHINVNNTVCLDHTPSFNDKKTAIRVLTDNYPYCNRNCVSQVYRICTLHIVQ